VVERIDEGKHRSLPVVRAIDLRYNQSFESIPLCEGVSE
jgi:hypothetical protein